MIEFPDRLSTLIQRLESGPPVTQQEVDRLATLQALDLARIGQDFVRQRLAAEESHTKSLEVNA